MAGLIIKNKLLRSDMSQSDWDDLKFYNKYKVKKLLALGKMGTFISEIKILVTLCG